MKDQIWKRDEVKSPCVKICVIHPDAEICTGCLRTMDEIAAWSRLAPDERKAVLTDLPSRRALLKQRRGGRNARLKRRNAG